MRMVQASRGPGATMMRRAAASGGGGGGGSFGVLEGAFHAAGAGVAGAGCGVTGAGDADGEGGGVPPPGVGMSVGAGCSPGGDWACAGVASSESKIVAAAAPPLVLNTRGFGFVRGVSSTEICPCNPLLWEGGSL